MKTHWNKLRATHSIICHQKTNPQTSNQIRSPDSRHTQKLTVNRPALQAHEIPYTWADRSRSNCTSRAPRNLSRANWISGAFFRRDSNFARIKKKCSRSAVAQARAATPLTGGARYICFLIGIAPLDYISFRKIHCLATWDEVEREQKKEQREETESRFIIDRSVIYAMLFFLIRAWINYLFTG